MSMRRCLVGVMLLAAACGVPDGSPVRITVPPGASLGSVADSLAARGVIGSKRIFTLQARIRGTDRSIKPGLYEFTPGTSVGALLDQLSRGDAVRLRVTLPEGGTIFDLARSTETRLGIPRDSVLKAARDPAIRAAFGIDAPSVEGWLLPQTFDFEGTATASDIVRRFVEERIAAWDSSWTSAAAAAGLDRKAVLTLASIVEAEAQVADELPTIAAVYRNRLRIGMALQADPTIQYAYLLRDGARKPRLFNADYEFDSPWNTYLHAGLPPGPISNPTQAAIAAVLAPADVPYLYFVADSNGRHRFSTSYDGHLRAIRDIRE